MVKIDMAIAILHWLFNFITCLLETLLSICIKRKVKETSGATNLDEIKETQQTELVNSVNNELKQDLDYVFTLQSNEANDNTLRLRKPKKKDTSGSDSATSLSKQGEECRNGCKDNIASNTLTNRSTKQSIGREEVFKSPNVVSSPFAQLQNTMSPICNEQYVRPHIKENSNVVQPTKRGVQESYIRNLQTPLVNTANDPSVLNSNVIQHERQTTKTKSTSCSSHINKLEHKHEDIIRKSTNSPKCRDIKTPLVVTPANVLRSPDLVCNKINHKSNMIKPVSPAQSNELRTQTRDPVPQYGTNEQKKSSSICNEHYVRPRLVDYSSFVQQTKRTVQESYIRNLQTALFNTANEPSLLNSNVKQQEIQTKKTKSTTFSSHINELKHKQDDSFRKSMNILKCRDNKTSHAVTPANVLSSPAPVYNSINYTSNMIKSVSPAPTTVLRSQIHDPVPKYGSNRQRKVSQNSRYGKPQINFINTGWKPPFNTYVSTRKPSYNSIRRRKYQKTNLYQEHHQITVLQFYEERVKVDTVVKTETHNDVNTLLQKILKNKENRRQFSVYPNDEGSVAVGLKVGQADESDHSVDILVDNQLIQLTDEPFTCEYKGDDIDNFFKDEVSTIFVHDGKRYFPYEVRQLHKKRRAPEIPNGFVGVSIGKKDVSRFRECCIPRQGHMWLLPYPILSEFHHFVANAVNGFGGVTLNKAARGPAITLTLQQDGGPNISVDITLKLTLENETLSVMDFQWPRRDTRKWLSEEKIDEVACQLIYLVPKGDKYWQISFANCEYEILRDIDGNGTWRKACLRIMKKKLMQWQSKSRTGLKGLSSYLLKTTLLWLCEILPEDEYWWKEELSNRYFNFLQEFSIRLKRRSICVYFNPSINLLENKDEECIDELVQFIEEEISTMCGNSC